MRFRLFRGQWSRREYIFLFRSMKFCASSYCLRNLLQTLARPNNLANMMGLIFIAFTVPFPYVISSSTCICPFCSIRCNKSVPSPMKAHCCSLCHSHSLFSSKRPPSPDPFPGLDIIFIVLPPIFESLPLFLLCSLLPLFVLLHRLIFHRHQSCARTFILKPFLGSLSTNSLQ